MPALLQISSLFVKQGHSIFQVGEELRQKDRIDEATGIVSGSCGLSRRRRGLQPTVVQIRVERECINDPIPAEYDLKEIIEKSNQKTLETSQ